MKVRRLVFDVIALAVLMTVFQLGISGTMLKFEDMFLTPQPDRVADQARKNVYGTAFKGALLISGLSLLVICGFGLVVMRRVSRGCSALESAAKAVGEGDLSHRIQLDQKDEFGEVAAQFDSMAERLQVAEAKVREQTDEIKKQQELAESLLLNVLPSSVAEELKTKGAVDPKYHEDVTVLFTDFQGFTLSTEKLAAEELVSSLHEYFTSFDKVVEGYGLEKLKTIGDSYMCVAGLPERKASHAVDAVLAAFAILDEVRRAHAKGLPPWSVRIGVHTGPVISGVVGIRKFAFDIWGESVNFASRVESSGSANRINLSAATFSRVKDFFQCENRGLVNTKEGRAFEMYFATGVARDLSQPEVQMRENFANRYRKYFQRDLQGLPECLLVRTAAAG